MIDSPAQHVEDLHFFVKKSGISLRHTGPRKITNEEVTRKTQDLIHWTASTTFFGRMSWVNKLKFLTCLVKKIRSLGTITLLLNTLHSVTGKVAYYCKSSKVTPIDFDREIFDHDRMLDPVTLNKTVKAELQWFGTLDDREQVAFYITFLRFSGGALIAQLYQRIQVVYAHRLNKLSTIVVNETQKETEVEENTSGKERNELLQKLDERHNLQDPKHQKVLKLTKTFNDTMGKLKKNVESKAATVEKEPKENKKKKDNKDLDWIQLMPIYIVKQIFIHLDKKSLERAKKVNAYWKWAISELVKDKKAKKHLSKMHKKLKCTLPEPSHLEIQKPRVSHTEKRLQKLRERGAILEELRLTHLTADDTSSLMIEALKRISDSVPYIENITIFPRVRRTNSPLYKKPQYLVKDYKVICREGTTSSESEDDDVSQVHLSQSIVSESSDEIY